MNKSDLWSVENARFEKTNYPEIVAEIGKILQNQSVQKGEIQKSKDENLEITKVTIPDVSMI